MALLVSIVNTDNRERLRACLSSVLGAAGGIGLCVVVVDNASRDGSAAMVRSEFPEVVLIERESRAGYSANHNQALRLPPEPYALLLNEDTELLPGALAALLSFAEGNPRCGVVGPLVLNPNGSLQPSCNRFPHPAAEALRALLPAGWARRLDPALSAPAHACAGFPDWVGGVCLLLRRQALEQVGGLDEGFFLFYEEVDLCRRLRAAGWEVGFAPEARIMHHGGRTYAGDPWAWAAGCLRQSRRRYFRKHHGALAAALVGWADALGLARSLMAGRARRHRRVGG